MYCCVEDDEEYRVALRKESVDRNVLLALKMMKNTESLSARRAWIEMEKVNSNVDFDTVALRKESVDRNWSYVCRAFCYFCRSPQGERG